MRPSPRRVTVHWRAVCNGQLRMAALNQPYSGDVHGIRNADLQCHWQARKANLKGTFRAFLGSHVQNLDSIVGRKFSKLPVVNIKVRLSAHIKITVAQVTRPNLRLARFATVSLCITDWRLVCGAFAGRGAIQLVAGLVYRRRGSVPHPAAHLLL